MKLRRFNDAGVQAFRSYLEELHRTPTLDPPPELLEDGAQTILVPESIDVERVGFATKCDAAKYLHQALQPIIGTNLFKDVGLWSWLSCFYFDDVCPAHAGRRKPLQTAHYVLDVDHRRSYMHLLASSLRILLIAPEFNRLFLEYPPNVRSEVMQAMMSRLYLMRIPCIPEVLELLYYDVDRRRPKRRAVTASSDARAGDLTNRFPARIRQLERTYDVWTLAAQDLIRLLGAEFKPWVPDPVLTL